MKYLLPLLLSAASFVASVSVGQATELTTSGDEVQSILPDQPYYLYKGQRIPLDVSGERVAVALRPKVAVRGDVTPQYLKLQEALNAGTRSPVGVQVVPLGEQYAIATVPVGTRGGSQFLERRLAQQSALVETTLPVLSRPDQGETLLLKDELIVRFNAETTVAEREATLAKHGVEMVRPLFLSEGHFVVQTQEATGLAALQVANALLTEAAVETVSPNFVQQAQHFPSLATAEPELAPSLAPLNLTLPSAQTSRAAGQSSLLLPWQWHISSTPLRSCMTQAPKLGRELAKCLLPQSQPAKQTASLPIRTDLRVQEVWDHGQKGKGTVVAVLDSLIQWDHPALRNSLHKVTQADRCENETYGWDFTSAGRLSEVNDLCEFGDGETRMDVEEFNLLKSRLGDALMLADEALLKQYSYDAQKLRFDYPQASDEAISNAIRRSIQQNLRKEFHGTAVSSVVAATSSERIAVTGVAPEAKVLPVRVLGINGSFSLESYLVALGYAADRGADVINLSLGGPPMEAQTEVIAQLQETYPHLVLVASSGNYNTDKPLYPAALPGVLSVGATNLAGERSPYSNYGNRLDVVAPGGDLSGESYGGFLVAGGTWSSEFWQDIPEDKAMDGHVLDPLGAYHWTQGTSFSAPAVSGVVALMKGEDPDDRLDRQQITEILRRTASPDNLSLAQEDMDDYQSRLTDKAEAKASQAKRFYFGQGLVVTTQA